MTWLNPWGWLWLGMAIPVVLLYILRIRRRRVPVSTTQFWEEMLAESRPRAWWQQLRHRVSLLLQLLLLLLLTAALADPLSASQSRDRRLVILLVDRSASMNARTLDGRTGFEEALRVCHREVDGLREWDEALVIGFADDVEMACGRTAHPGELRRALDAIRPSDRAGDVSRALALAHRLQAPDRVKEIVVCTDMPPIAAGKVSSSTTIRWRQVGEAVDNLAITAFSARAHSERRTEIRVLARLANFAAAEKEVSAMIRLDGQSLDGISARLKPGEDRAFIMTYDLPEGGLLEVELLDVETDALPADNRAYLQIPAPKPVRVGVVSTDANWFLEHALSAVPLVKVIHLLPRQVVDPRALDLVIYDRVTPEALPPVHSLFIQPDADTPLWTLGEPLQNVLISSIAKDAPLLRYTHFERVSIPAGRAISPIGGRALLRAFGTSLLHTWEGSDAHRTALMIDLQRSDLALRTAFPILIANLIHWYTGQTSGIYTGLQPGALGPEGVLERVGLYESDQGRLCVNLVHAGESDLRRAPGTEGRSPSEARTLSRPGWRWLALVALVLIAVEWGMHQRRWVE